VQHLLLKVLLILLEDGELPELEKSLNEGVRDDKMILTLINVIQELMTYLPSDRVTASEALKISR
jgi:hypothetical protein